MTLDAPQNQPIQRISAAGGVHGQEGVNNAQNDASEAQNPVRAQWENEPLKDKLFREAYLVTTGTARGFELAADKFVEQPADAALKLGLAGAVGVGVSFLTRGTGMKAVLGLGALCGLTAVAVKDSVEHLTPAYEAFVDTYKSSDNFSRNMQKWQGSAGTFLFDTTVYGVAGGAIGSYAGNRLFASNNLFGSVTRKEALPLLLSQKDIPAATRMEPLSIAAQAADNLALKPLNIVSKSDEAIGRLMGNFAETPFTFRGQKFASVEGFYHSLKFAEPELQNRVAAMHGPMAKSFGHKGNPNTGFFQGETFQLGTPQHHDLVKQAIRAKLEQHPQIASEFVSTYPRPIIHETGYKPPRRTNLPNDVFTRILTELRDEFFHLKSNSADRT